MIEIAVAMFVGLSFLVVVDCLNPQKPSRTSEEELGDAIAKYLSASQKNGNDQKDAKK